MSIARKAVRGAVWTVALSISSRVLGLFATIYIARYIAPDVEGEVKNAWFLALTASTATRLGIDQYIIVKHDDGDDVPFHCTVLSFLAGIPILLLVLILGGIMAGPLKSPQIAQYIPGAVAGIALRRMAAIPDRILIRDLRFRTSALIQGLSEIIYVSVALALAVIGFGGDSIILGNVVQAGFMLAATSSAVGWRAWLAPCRLTWQRARDILAFGLPINFEILLHMGAAMWDSILLSSRFGAGVAGIYLKARSLADVPAEHIGEQIGGVLLPSMAKIEPQRRVAVMIRSIAILAILIFPMAVGLGIVAPTLVPVILPPEWHAVSSFLLVLSTLAVFRPMSWVIGSYFKITNRTGLLFCVEAVKVVFLLSSVWFAPSPLWACIGIGLAFAAHSVAMIASLAWIDRVSPLRFVPGFFGPAIACVVMSAAVFGVRYGFVVLGIDNLLIRIVAEISAGAIAYVPAAFIFTPATTRDVLGLLRKAFGRSR